MDVAVHLAGWLFAAIFIPALILQGSAADGLAMQLSRGLYAFAVVASLGFSGLYNIAPPSRAKAILRRLDHAAIFVLIAGTYGPFTLVALGGAWGLGLFAVLWGFVFLGVGLAFLLPGRVDRFSLVLYLLMGWSILPFVGQLLAAIPILDILLLLGGGLLYTSGIGFHLATRLRYQRALWHLFVLAAVICHYVAVHRVLDSA